MGRSRQVTIVGTVVDGGSDVGTKMLYFRMMYWTRLSNPLVLFYVVLLGKWRLAAVSV